MGRNYSLNQVWIFALHLFNRKFIKDIDELYGTYQAGEAVVERSPLTSYTFEDAEPGIVAERG